MWINVCTQNMFFKEVQLILTNSVELLKIHGVEALVLEVKHMHIWLWSMCRESLDIPWIFSGKQADCSEWRTNAWKEIRKITVMCCNNMFWPFLKSGWYWKGCLEEAELSHYSIQLLRNCVLSIEVTKQYYLQMHYIVKHLKFLYTAVAPS